MKTCLTKSLLSLFLLLVSWGCLHAHPWTTTKTSLSKDSQSSELVVFDAHEKGLAFNEKSGDTKERHVVRSVVEVREEEDKHEWASLKKRSKAYNFLTLVFCCDALKYFSSCVRELLSFHNDFLYFSSHERLVIFQVFRIWCHNGRSIVWPFPQFQVYIHRPVAVSDGYAGVLYTHIYSIIKSVTSEKVNIWR